MNLNGRLSIIVAALTMMALACTEMPENDSLAVVSRSEVTINADWPVTKTSLEGKTVLWSEGDSVTVIGICDDYGQIRIDYDYGSHARNINGSAADFTAMLMGDHEPAYMIYPGNESVVYDPVAGTLITQTVGTFTAVAGTFNEGSNLSVGLVNDGTTVMKNLMSVFKFEITGSDIVSASIQARAGESLWGNVTIDAETLEITSIAGYPSITIVPEDGQTHITPGIYYIPVPAGIYAEGLAVDLVDDQGFHARKNKMGNLELPSGKLIDLGRQTDWGVEIHLGMCVTGTLTETGTNEFCLSDNLIRGKDFELENTVCGIEYSTDKGLTWTSVEFGVPDSESFDVDFEVVSPGKLLYRSWAKYRDDDIVRGDQRAFVPDNHVFTINFQNSVDVEKYLQYPGSDAGILKSWPSVSRRTDKEYVGEDVWKGVEKWTGGTSWNNEENVSWDRFKMQVVPGYWADWRILFPGPYNVSGSNGNSTTWYGIDSSADTRGFRFGLKNTVVSIPAVPGCRLDRVKMVYTTTSRKAQISSTYTKATPVGPVKSVVAASEITADVIAERPDLAGSEGLFWSEFTELSTNPGATGVTTEENTEYYIYTSTNAWMKSLELEYIPVE